MSVLCQALTIAMHLVMLAHLEAMRAVILVGLEDRGRAIKVIEAVLHPEDRMPTVPRIGKHVSSVDKSNANVNANGGSLCPSQSVRLRGKGCRRGGTTPDVGIEIVDPVVVDLASPQINNLGRFRLIFVGPLALTHNPI
ncbi:MAG: hypothetical protein NZ768_09125 [Pseudomonadales bacterium]|nr:hypothetical protein [Pseudomonadales bacterium]